MRLREIAIVAGEGFESTRRALNFRCAPLSDAIAMALGRTAISASVGKLVVTLVDEATGAATRGRAFQCDGVGELYAVVSGEALAAADDATFARLVVDAACSTLDRVAPTWSGWDWTELLALLRPLRDVGGLSFEYKLWGRPKRAGVWRCDLIYAINPRESRAWLECQSTSAQALCVILAESSPPMPLPYLFSYSRVETSDTHVTFRTRDRRLIAQVALPPVITEPS